MQHLPGVYTRRTMLAHTGAVLGLGLLSATNRSPAALPAQFDVTSYGATGKRGDNATKAFRDAIAACNKRRCDRLAYGNAARI